MKKKTALVILLGIIVFVWLISDVKFPRAENVPTCTHTTIDKYLECK